MKRNIRVGDYVQYTEPPFYRGSVIGVTTTRPRRYGKRQTIHVITVQLGENSYLSCVQEELTIIGGSDVGNKQAQV